MSATYKDIGSIKIVTLSQMRYNLKRNGQDHDQEVMDPNKQEHDCGKYLFEPSGFNPWQLEQYLKNYKEDGFNNLAIHLSYMNYQLVTIWRKINDSGDQGCIESNIKQE